MARGFLFFKKKEKRGLVKGWDLDLDLDGGGMGMG